MKRKTTLWLMLWLASPWVHAVNPVQGWYGGLFLGASYTPNLTIPIPYNTTALPATDAVLGYRVFGNLGLEGGYRYCHFRGEAEILINNNPYSYLKYAGFTVDAPSTSTGLRLKGQTTTGAFLINGFYDIYTPDTETSLVPYVGAGVGYATVRNNIKLYYNNILVPGSNFSRSGNAPAIQGIVGLSYFLDDFASFGLDYRYFTTGKVNPYQNRVNTNSINISFVGGFNAG